MGEDIREIKKQQAGKRDTLEQERNNEGLMSTRKSRRGTASKDEGTLRRDVTCLRESPGENGYNGIRNNGTMCARMGRAGERGRL